MLYIGIDDTDILNSRGTGNLARTIASTLSSDYSIHGVVRHQLLKDPRVPCTSHNSSAAIVVDYDGGDVPEGLFEQVREIMLSDFFHGSDPGLCMLCDVPAEIQEFGREAKARLVKQEQAIDLARSLSVRLEGLGGTNDGVIGALAAVGLSSFGEDGRYVLCGSIRDLSGLKSVPEVLDSGVTEIRTMEGEPVTEGFVKTDKIRPARRESRPIAYVEWNGDHWNPLKLD